MGRGRRYALNSFTHSLIHSFTVVLLNPILPPLHKYSPSFILTVRILSKERVNASCFYYHGGGKENEKLSLGSYSNLNDLVGFTKVQGLLGQPLYEALRIF